MRWNESTYERPARQTRAVVASLLLAVGGGCGGATLDTTNADTFDRTFDAMIADPPQAEAGSRVKGHPGGACRRRGGADSAGCPTQGT